MGIRIHKAIGYGLTDVKADTKKWKIIDERFNPNGYVALDCETQEEKYTIEGFKEYLRDRIKGFEKDSEEYHEYFNCHLLLRDLEKNDEKFNMRGTVAEFYQKVIYDMEFGLPNVILFIPPWGCNDWKRYDDIIDYYEPANSNENGPCDSVIPLNRGIWPYDWYLNIKEMPPKRITTKQWDIYHFLKNREFNAEGFTKDFPKELGMDTTEEIKKYIIPSIPIDLIEMLKYLEVFKDERSIYDLRPMIYGYWG